MRRLRAGLAIALGGLVISGVPAGTGSASGVPAAQHTGVPKTGGLPEGHSWKVTLLSGDVVHVRTVHGRPPLVSVDPGPGRQGVPLIRDIRPDGTIRIIPADVGRLIGKKIDPALFNVTTLIKERDDDASRPTLPLIVRGGSATGRNLAALHATAVRQPKSSPAAALTAPGVTHIWLDRKIQATKLDRDLTQIGAPAAWRAGATGRGVNVAVLDTGIDATHPDLKNKIAEQRNFAAGSTDTVDRFGHGTHVAATIAGTGVASHGEREGVAPDARLFIGKVLDDNGQGQESDLIAGMEWAASKAEIVNMSLGGPADPGSDPVAKAVDDLTAQDGTLFVVAAGNDGPAPDTIGSPGTAPAALTVGAVDGTDTPADFSSRGGSLLKPDIAAPGVQTISARAAGTTLGTPVDAYYTALSGTSMATPHVAGAAADLLQEHPDWGPARLKPALTSTADPVTGSVYQVGAGRLDVGTAVAATVTADDSGVAFGRLPHGSTQAVTRKLSWTNTGSSPVELRLSAPFTDHRGQDPGAVRVPASVTVPAHGSASATLTLDPARLSTAGAYSGAVTARANGRTLRTPLGAFAQPETHMLTLKATPYPGTTAGNSIPFAGVINLDDPHTFTQVPDFGASGVATVPVAAGRYAVLGFVDSYVTKPNAYRETLVGTSEVNIDRDTTVPLDASRSEPVTIAAPGASKMSDVSVDMERGTLDGIWDVGVTALSTISPGVYSTPVDAPKTGTFDVYVGGRVSSDDGTKVYDLLHKIGSRIPEKIHYTAVPEDLARIDERFHALGGNTGAPDFEQRYGVTPTGVLATQDGGKVAAGSTRTDYVTAAPGIRWLDEVAPPDPNNIGWIVEEPARQFSNGSVSAEDWVRQPIRPGPYSRTDEVFSECAPRPVTREPGNIHVELVALQDRIDGFDCTPGLADPLLTQAMTLYAGDRIAGTAPRSFGDFTVPRTAGTYRLVYNVDASKLTPVSAKTSTTWTFRSKPGEIRVPLLTVDYGLPLDLLNHAGGGTATLTVARVKGSAVATATGLKLWTSFDDGRTWTEATVTGSNGRYAGRLPKITKDQAVSLRVRATDSGGGAIDQTIVHAYTGA